MDKIEELLTRAVDTIYPSREELEKVLRNGKKLRLYQGFDPTGTQLHIGHMIGLRKLSQWQDLGHHVVFLIGDGTGQAGDPSGKTKARDTFMTREQLRENAKDYVMQAGKIVNFTGENPVEILYNGDWLNKLGLVDILNIMDHLSLQQMIERDLFQERMRSGEILKMREFMYPMLQGYDSVAMEVDLELGGSDQMFNMLIGRKLVKEMLNRDKFVMTTPLLTDSKGVKVGKTEGNVIALTDSPNELFGKIMALSDDVIVKGLEYLTDVQMDEIKTIEQKLRNGENPVVFKKQLAFEIVKQLNSEKQAKDAQEHFEKTVQQKEMPEEISSIVLPKELQSGATVADVLVHLELVGSRSEAKRVIEQHGVTVANEVVDDPNAAFSPIDGTIIKVGKRRFVKIKMSS